MYRRCGDKPRYTTEIELVFGHQDVSTDIVGLATDTEIRTNTAASDPPYRDADQIKPIRVGTTS